MKDSRERLAWVDCLRFLGMLAVYIGHFGEAAGNLYTFVFTYHVPLFFFAAGFFAGPRDESAIGMVLRLARRLLLPYVFFALLFAATLALFYDWPWAKLQAALVTFAEGTRNHMPASSLWFLPCLFVTAVAHGLVLRWTRSAAAALAFGLACLLVATQGLLPVDPVARPSWPLTADSALYYVFWYALGHATFPFLRRAVHGAWFGVAGLVAAVGTAWIYFNGAADLQALLAPMGPGPLHVLVGSLLGVLVVAVAIVANIAVARSLEGVRLLGELGRRTLVLCGTEDFIKLVLSQLLIVFGLKLQLIHPLGVVLYSFAALCAGGLLVGRFLEAHAPRWSGLRSVALEGPARPESVGEVPAPGLFARAARFWGDSRNG